MSHFITLRCNECDNINCKTCPCGTHLHEYSKRGCIKEVTEDTYIKYFHYMNEILPFFKTYKYETTNNYYIEIISFLEYIYSLPTVNKLNNYGKVIDSESLE